ncbi:uncharacterized protein LOC128725588 [Anopheles nili]|uniref:uncharacterized protein LOC128725588 n=1 Tax=Anopheles nili TaxID=185578 RepID=UPI00237B796D|nr:uncharacterized protein LOC128725588 [Anopheles nili]
MGIRKCIVPECPSTTARSEDRGVTFHKIPYQEETKRAWITACHLPDGYNASKMSNVCSRHFRKADFQEFKGKKYVLKTGIVPTIFPWTNGKGSEKSDNDQQAMEGAKETVEDSPMEAKIDKGKNEDVPHEVGDKDDDINRKDDVKKVKTETPTGRNKNKSKITPKRASSARKSALTLAKKARVDPSPTPKKQTVKKGASVVVEPPSPAVCASQAADNVESAPEKVIDFTPGGKIEAQDFSGTWHAAKLIEVDTEEREVLVQFDKTEKIKSSTLEEWIPMDSVRLRPISSASFTAGEKVFARWNDSRKFKATIKSVLENDMYEVIFDDGFAKICKATHISRGKRPEDAIVKGVPADLSPEKEPIKVNESSMVIKTEPVEQAEGASEMQVAINSINQLRIPQLVKLSELPEVPTDGEWCCHWMNDYPVGESSEVDLPGGRVYTVIVPDWRLPEGWTKHVYQRFTTYGKMDVVLVNPAGKVIRSKHEMKQYLADGGEAYDLNMFDFGLHRKRAKELGFCQYTQEYKDSFLPKPAAEPMLLNTEVNIGSVKVKIIDNLYQCPEADCLKTFRKENHLQIHIKHYHKELAKGLGEILNMQDLAALRTPLDLLETPRSTGRKSNVSTTPKASSNVMKEEKKDEVLVKSELAAFPPTPEEGKPIKEERLKSPGLVKQELEKHPISHGTVEAVAVPEETSVKKDQQEEDESATVASPSSSTSKPKAQSRVAKIKLFSKRKQLDEAKKIRHGLVTKKKAGVTSTKRMKRGKMGRRSAANRSAPVLRGADSSMTYSPFAGFGGGLQNETTIGGAYYDDFINTSVGGSTSGLVDENGEVIKIVRMRKEEIINCLCKVTEEDGLMVQCEVCLCWQHAFCQNIRNSSEVPETYVCSICRYPYRGRASKRYVHDQDWLYEGKLPVAKYHSTNSRHAQRFDILKNAHTLTGNLLELKRFMHSLQVKINIAEKKDHPKMYLWSKKWEKSPPRSEGVEKLPSESAIQQQMPQVPVPEAPIDPAECQAILLDHIQKQQNDAMGRLQAIEAQIIGLEAYDEKADLLESPMAKNYPKTKQTIQMLLNDLLRMKKIAEIHSDFNSLVPESSRVAQQ